MTSPSVLDREPSHLSGDEISLLRQLRLLSDTLPQLVWTSTPDGRWEYVNRRWTEYTGIDGDGCLGIGWQSVIHPEDLQRFERGWQQAVREHEPFELEHRLLRHDGAYLWFLSRIEPGEDGGLIRWFGTSTDIDRLRRSTGSNANLGPSPPTSEAVAGGAPRPDILDSMFALALDAGRVGVFDWELKSGQMIWTRPLEELFGIAPGTFEGHYDGWARRVHPDDLARLEPCFRSWIVEGVDHPCWDYRFFLPDGELRLMEARARIVRDSQGVAVRFLGTNQDITDRHVALRALQESEQAAHRQLAELMATYDTASIGLAVFDKDLRNSRINKTHAEINGFSPEAHIGRTVGELIPDVEKQAGDMLRQTIETGEPLRGVEIVGETPAQAGVLPTWLASFCPLRRDDGRVLGLNAVCEEVTEHKRALESLRESEGRFRSMADSAPVMIWITDRSERCVYLNRQWYEFTGQTEESGLGLGWRNAVHPDDREMILRELTSSARQRKPFRVDYRLRRHDIIYRWCVDSGIPRLGPEGECIGYIGSVIDITERKQAEESLRAVDRRKDEFLAMLSHELRNPLAAIRNANTVAALDDSPDTASWSNGVIDRQSRILTTLIDDLLDQTRINQGKVQLSKQRIPVALAFHRAIEPHRANIHMRGQTLHVIVESVPMILDADPTRLEQVIGNLLSNAVKYTPHNGRIELAAHRERDEAIITVRDSGVGIPLEIQDRVFEMFAQADNTISHSQGGLGIGLSIVRALVQLHGGSIQAHSDGPGRGSTFTVRLPLATENSLISSRLSEASGSDSNGQTNQRVLLVDDNKDSIQMLGCLLMKLGHEVKMSHSGPDALATVREFSPDVVLLDLGLPGMSGYEVAERLRQDEATRHSLIIAVSGFGREHDSEQSRASGLDHHLVKPVEIQTLLRILNSRSVADCPNPGRTKRGMPVSGLE